MKPPRKEQPNKGSGETPFPRYDKPLDIDSISRQLRSAWEFIKDVLPKNDPLRRASGWFLVALALVGILLALGAGAGSAKAASAFVFVFMGVLAVVAFVNILYVVIPGERGVAARAYAFGRATIAVIILAAVVVMSASFRVTISRDGPAIMLSWLHGLGWVSISDAVAKLPIINNTAYIRDGSTLVENHRLDPFDDPRVGSAGIDTRRLLAALSSRKDIQIVGTVTVADAAAPHDTFILTARSVRIADGAKIEIGRSSLLIVTEVLEIGDKADHRATVVAYPREGEASISGASGGKAPSAGNVTIIVTDKVTNGTLAVDLRGRDGRNGSNGKQGESGDSFEPEIKPAGAKGFLVRFQTTQERAGARDAISKIRNDPSGSNRCLAVTECQQTLDGVEKYLAFCDQNASLCPDWASSVCFLPAEPGPNVPDEARYRGKEGGKAGNGEDGGDGGTLLVMTERGMDEPRIVLDPTTGPESDDKRTRLGASSGGAAGIPGLGGPGAKAIQGGANDPGKVCGVGQPGTEAAPGPSGPSGSHGRAGTAHKRIIKAISAQAL